MSDFYDRDGNPIALADWGRELERRAKVGDSKVANADGLKHHVSTVWLGLDHSFGEGPPLIFETMVFCEGHEGCGWGDYQERYSTEEQARAGHERIAARVGSGLEPK